MWRETVFDICPANCTMISIHSLRVEGDGRTCHREPTGHEFQSTPSVWRETQQLAQRFHDLSISIHSLRVEGDSQHICAKKKKPYFNPLPPCGGRPDAYERTIHGARFQSTPSVWRETYRHTVITCSATISIHSLRVEGDMAEWFKIPTLGDFNPLPPCGGRPD